MDKRTLYPEHSDKYPECFWERREEYWWENPDMKARFDRTYEEKFKNARKIRLHELF